MMGADLSARHAIDLLTERIHDAASGGGGWGYYPARTSRIEPTAWALLALHGAWTGTPAGWEQFADPHRAFLARCQTRTGALSDTGDSVINVAATGFAAAVLPTVGGTPASAVVASLVRAIVGVRGITAGQDDPRQDNSLQAWPWYPDTFSWVEPTAWCTLALKKSADAHAHDVEARIEEAERMLENRCCDAGGWNYGNASVIGQDLRPHVPPTALALVALQDRGDRPYVRRSVDFLEQARFKELSSLALGLTAIALRMHGRAVDDVRERLAGICQDAADRGDVQAMAVALFALTLDRHDAKALRVA
jgi:hypothetical protein